MIKVLLILSTVFMTSCITTNVGYSKQMIVEFDRTHLVEVIGPIRSSMAVHIATKIHHLTTKELKDTDVKKPLDIFINSHGGSVAAGGKILDAIAQAQYNGYTVRCAVGLYAMSMAFNILAACDERYALANADLLFHPARIMTRRPILAEVALYWGNELARINTEIAGDLIASTDMNLHEFMYHFEHETAWPAHVLASKTKPGWLQIVKGISNVNPYSEPRRGPWGSMESIIENLLMPSTKEVEIISVAPMEIK